MRKFLSKVYGFGIKLPHLIVPDFVKRRADPERFFIDEYIFEQVSPNLRKSDRLLDAGAGSFRYREALKNTKYESSDFAQAFDEASQGKHTYVCDICEIPVNDNTFDIVVNTQVVEHVPDPSGAIKEMSRVLKKGGKLYLTAPQISPVHGRPYNFFFFTDIGLKKMFEDASLDVIYIKPRGGVFCVLAKIFSILPTNIYYQVAFSGFKREIGFKSKPKNLFLVVLLFPVYFVLQILVGYLIPFIFFYLDKLDKQKDYTLGYAITGVKR